MKNVKYSGCFIDKNELEIATCGVERSPLAVTIGAPHVTFEYKPKSVNSKLIGQKIDVVAVGYGVDCENEALLVELTDIPDGLEAQAREIAVPHITLTVSESGEPVNSKYLSFVPIEPVPLTATFGVMLETGEVMTEAE